jgi:hypothetical protein
MREFLLSVASPESLTWLGFLLLAAGLLGRGCGTCRAIRKTLDP